MGRNYITHMRGKSYLQQLRQMGLNVFIWLVICSLISMLINISVFVFIFWLLRRLFLFWIFIGVLIVGCQPLRKLLVLELVAQDNRLDFFSELINPLLFLLRKQQFLWNVIFVVVVVECHLIEVQALARRQEYSHFLHWKRFLENVVVQILNLYLDQETNHFSYLMIDEALAEQLESKEMKIPRILDVINFAVLLDLLLVNELNWHL